ncbi:MAG: phage terminase large subunit family protein [Magnetospirillum sp.]|nr:phage terminase large subunit family protein [Magnetospirillum sp.]
MSIDWKPLAAPERLALTAFADAIEPPPPVDLNQWADDHVVISAGPQEFRGPYNSDRFPYFRRPLEVLSPEHPCREVVISASAQVGKTTLAQIFVGGVMHQAPAETLYTHPTEPNAIRWVKTKWKPFLRSTTVLGRLFNAEKSRDGGNSLLYMERRDGLGWIQISGANSAASLSMITAIYQVQDDLAKWVDNEAGDPEHQADSRSKAVHFAKVLKISTPLVEDNCRIARAFKRSNQQHFHVPCPHCRHEHPLEWENMLANLDENHPEQAHFTCPACGCVIEHRHKAWMAARGRWVAHNPASRVEGFYLWAAYSPLETWERIAEAWLNAKGNPSAEQTFLNDTVGRAYKASGEAPPWEGIRDRAEAEGHIRGKIPAGALLVTYGVDCQGDRVEVHVKGFGRDLKRWTIDYLVIPGHISEAECRAELDRLIERDWPTVFGSRRKADMLAIDAGAWQSEVMDWTRTHSQFRVIATKGAKSDQAPEFTPIKEERRRDGSIVKFQKRFWSLGVSRLKSALYSNLKKSDPLERGFSAYPKGLEDEFYRQLTSERRQPVKTKTGYEQYRWVKDPGIRNEVLDTELIAEAAAIRLGWKRLTDSDFDRLAAEREVSASPGQTDLFDPDQAAARPAAAPPPAAVANAVRKQSGPVRRKTHSRFMQG